MLFYMCIISSRLIVKIHTINHKDNIIAALPFTHWKKKKCSLVSEKVLKCIFQNEIHSVKNGKLRAEEIKLRAEEIRNLKVSFFRFFLKYF